MEAATIKCNLCPRQCGVDRDINRGFCQATNEVKVALVNLHQWEEPCISGKTGAGTVFFSHCTMKCAFCQNYQISHDGFGIIISVNRLAQIFIEQQQRRATNVELVTPTHYTNQIISAVNIAKSNGLSIPVAWNSNGYERVETIRRLQNTVDIYMPDLKYFDDQISVKFSNTPNYFYHASRAITAMVEQIGAPVFDGDVMKRGVLVRHLILPNHRRDSIKIVDWLHKTFGNHIYISLMNQYTPMFRAERFKEINRCLTTFEYQSVINHALDIGVTNCFIQTGGAATTDFVPNFDGSFVHQIR